MVSKIRHGLRILRSTFRETVKRHTRSPKWAKLEKEFVKHNPLCAACGAELRIQVHHIQPYHLHPELELEPKNLIQLCMGPNECHFLLGHGASWKAYSPSIVSLAHSARNDPVKLKKTQEKAKKTRKLE